MADNQPTTNLPDEEWKPVVGYEKYYEVSNMGRVRSFDRLIVRSNGVEHRHKGIILTPHPYVSGHLQVNLMVDGKQYKRRVHRLVMLTFIGPCPDGMEVCHNDGDPTNNRLDNLRYDTHSRNMLDRNKHGTCHYRKRTHCPLGHPLEWPNLMPAAWKKDGHRSCRACNRASARISAHPEWKSMRKEMADSAYREIMAS